MRKLIWIPRRIADRQPRIGHGLVAEVLGRALVTGAIVESPILRGDTDLSARVAVSRTVLRHARKILAVKRLCEPKAKVGTRVLDRALCCFFDSKRLGWRRESASPAP